MLKLMNKVWKKEVKKYGYRPPVSDGNRGGNGKFDVYLAQIGDAGLYGYCAPERRKPGYQWLASGYCVLDNDFVGVPPRPDGQREGDRRPRVLPRHPVRLRLRRGRLAARGHRHLDGGARLRRGQRQPSVPPGRPGLRPDVSRSTSSTPTGSQQYGNWPFFEFLSKNYGNGVVKAIWNKAGRVRRRPGPLLHQGDQRRAEAQGRVHQELQPVRLGQPAARQVLPRGRQAGRRRS